MRRRPLLVLAALGLVACGSGEAAAPPPPAPTVGEVGRLPGEVRPPVTDAVGETVDAVAPASTDGPSGATATPDDRARRTTTTVGDDERLEPIGRLVEGNRVLVIGDSILASISNRYGGQLCDRLVPRGWAVEVDAEIGRNVEFGRRVLDRRLADGWDAAVVMLGNNYGGDPMAYGAELDELLDELEPRPVVLLNITEFRDAADEVNYVIAAEAKQRDHVYVLDWAARTSDAAELLGADGLHLSEIGRAVLADMISTALGRAPAGSVGSCLRSTFTNDAAGSVTGSG